MRRWYATAIVCGLIPMALGSAIFAAWLVTDLDALEIIGVVFIYGGIFLFAAGIAALLIFVSRARRGGVAYRKSAALALVVLVANFPLCAAYVAIAFAMKSAHVVAVENRAGMAMEDLGLRDPTGRHFGVGSVGPGQTRQVCLDLSGEGAVGFSFSADGRPYAGILIGYLAGPLGSRATLRLAEDLSAQVSEEFRRISLAEFLRTCLLGQER